MKFTLISSAILLNLLFILSLTGCQTDGSTPSLSGNTPNTSRLPSPTAYQRNSAMTASTMIAPQRP